MIYNHINRVSLYIGSTDFCDSGYYLFKNDLKDIVYFDDFGQNCEGYYKGDEYKEEAIYYIRFVDGNGKRTIVGVRFFDSNGCGCCGFGINGLSCDE
jgi:hypothetical protein